MSDCIWLALFLVALIEGAVWGITRIRESTRKNRDSRKFRDITGEM